VADGVDARIDAMKVAGADPTSDRGARDSDSEELAA
jgi:hypothetical protein